MFLDLNGGFDRIAAFLNIQRPREIKRLLKIASFEDVNTKARENASGVKSVRWKKDGDSFGAPSNMWIGKLSQNDLGAYEARISDLFSPQERQWLEFGGLAGQPPLTDDANKPSDGLTRKAFSL